MKFTLPRASKTIRHICVTLWAIIVIAAVTLYLTDPSAFTPDRIAGFLSRFAGLIWAVYFGFSALRGFTLLPSTPLVLAGVILFPEQRFAVLFTSLAAIALSSTMIYFFSEVLGFDKYFERRKPELVHRIKRQLEHPLGFLFVSAWAFFPLVPTDLVCYLAGTSRMNYRKFIAAVLAGEAVLCIFYIFFGGSLVDYLRSRS